MCATFLKQHEHDSHEKKNIVFRTFEKYYGRIEKTYVGHIGSAIKHAPRWMIVFALLTVLAGLLFTRLPSSFVPEEDQGYALAIVQLPRATRCRRPSRCSTRCVARCSRWTASTA